MIYRSAKLWCHIAQREEIHYCSGQFSPKTKTFHSNGKAKLILALHEPGFICQRTATFPLTSSSGWRMEVESWVKWVLRVCTHIQFHPLAFSRRQVLFFSFPLSFLSHSMPPCIVYIITHSSILSYLTESFIVFHTALHFWHQRGISTHSWLLMSLFDVTTLLCQVITSVVCLSCLITHTQTPEQLWEDNKKKVKKATLVTLKETKRFDLA